MPGVRPWARKSPHLGQWCRNDFIFSQTDFFFLVKKIRTIEGRIYSAPNKLPSRCPESIGKEKSVKHSSNLTIDATKTTVSKYTSDLALPKFESGANEFDSHIGIAITSSSSSNRTTRIHTNTYTHCTSWEESLYPWLRHRRCANKYSSW